VEEEFLDCCQSLRASPQWPAATTVADVSIPESR
jgi:hypothetical protein